MEVSLCPGVEEKRLTQGGVLKEEAVGELVPDTQRSGDTEAVVRDAEASLQRLVTQLRAGQ